MITRPPNRLRQHKVGELNFKKCATKQRMTKTKHKLCTDEQAHGHSSRIGSNRIVCGLPLIIERNLVGEQLLIENGIDERVSLISRNHHLGLPRNPSCTSNLAISKLCSRITCNEAAASPS